MPEYRDPYGASQKALLRLIGLGVVLSVLLILFRQGAASAQSPSPSPDAFGIPKDAIIGTLYVSDGATLDKELGMVYWDPGTTVGTLYIELPNGKMFPIAEITITYWVENPLTD